MADNFKFPATPPREAIRYLSAKGYKPSFHWQDTWGLEHAFDFTVAKAMRLEILTTVHKDLFDNLKSGQTYHDWAKSITPKLQKLGWWGKTTMIDPATGQPQIVTLGTPRRLRVIYNANIRSARAAGAWERIERTKRALPFLLYQIGPSENHRAEHVARHGTMLPIDHDFWASHYPPNGWGCKCWVRQISRAEAESLGGTSPDPKIDYVPFTNKRTGEQILVPADIDPGWQTNPGKARGQNLRAHLNGKLERAPASLRRAAIADMAGSNLLRLMHQGAITAKEATVPVGVMAAGTASKLGAKTPVVVVSGETMKKQGNNRGDLSFDDYAKIQELLDSGAVLPNKRRAGFDIRKRIGGNWWRAIIKLTDAGELFLVSVYHRRRGWKN